MKVTNLTNYQNSKNSRIFFRLNVLAIFFLFLVVTFPNLGFARDDWNHYASLRNLSQSLGDWEAIHQITTNQWFGAHELRIFFLSFYTHFFIAKTVIAAELIYFVQLSLHVASAALLGSVFLKKFNSVKLAITVVGLLVFAPAVSQSTFWINNLFFVQPWFFLSLALWIAIVPKMTKAYRLTWIAISSLICTFSGEGTIPLLIGLLSALTWNWIKNDKRVSEKIVSSLPLATVIGSLIFYIFFVMSKPQSASLHFENILNFPKYFAQASWQASQISIFNSEYFGYATIAPNFVTFTVALIIAGMFSFIYSRMEDLEKSGKSRFSKTIFLYLTISFIFACIPQLIGVITGARPGPELRYLYVPAQVAIIWIVAVVWLFFSSLGITWRRIVAVLTVAILTYFAALTTYNATIVWSEQAKIDDQIWQQLDKHSVNTQWGIVTYHPLHPYLMAPYHSNAVSDFQADWGIAGRLQWLHPERPRMQVYRDAELSHENLLTLRNYYDDNLNCTITSQSSNFNKVLFMIYDYGKNFGELKNSSLLITEDFAKFSKMRDKINSKYSAPKFNFQSESNNPCPN